LAIYNSYSVDVAYIDFSKAFGSVCHTKLIRELESVGTDGKLLSWMNDYLSGVIAIFIFFLAVNKFDNRLSFDKILAVYKWKVFLGTV